MKRRIVAIFCILIVIFLILSLLSPLLFAETVEQTYFSGNMLPFGIEIIIGVAAGALLLLLILRLILFVNRKK